MSKRNRNKGGRPHQLAANTSGKSTGNKLLPQMIEKSISQTRQDIAKMRTARNGARNVETPTPYMLYQLYDYILDDALLTSQIENRIQDSLGSVFNLRKKGGDIDEELTNTWQNSELFNEIITQIINTRFHGHSLIELDWKAEGQNEPQLVAGLIPRTNILAKKGVFLFDYNEEKGVKYRELPEFGTWLLEFGKPGEFGLLDKAIPHALFKRYAQSCWSELAEIHGIPPRWMKTDTTDPAAMNRGKRMMADMGAAAWLIIDSTEEFGFANGVQTNGDVYNNLLRYCDNQNSMLISGAIIGQDTVNGNRSKEESSQKMLSKLVLADMAMVEMYMNSKVMPALARIGIIPADYEFKWEISEDLAELWNRAMQAEEKGFEVDFEWLADKFGIKIIGRKQMNPTIPGSNLNIAESFFV